MIELSSVVALPLVLALLGLLYNYSKPKRPFPPGPSGLPIIGSLLDINNERPWITYGKWARQYGDIVMYTVMGGPVILLGSMEHAQKLLQKRMTNYGDRPELVVAQELVTQNGWYIGTARTKHKTHRKHRKILGERLRASMLRDWAQPVEIPEMHLFLQRLVQRPEKFVSIIKLFTVNVMLRTTFGHGSIQNFDNPLVARINRATDHQFTAQIQGRFWVDYLPFLNRFPTWLPGMGWKRIGLQWREEVNSLYLDLWNSTKSRMEEQRDKSPVPR